MTSTGYEWGWWGVLELGKEGECERGAAAETCRILQKLLGNEAYEKHEAHGGEAARARAGAPVRGFNG